MQISYDPRDTVHQLYYEDDLSLESRVSEPERGKKGSIGNAARRGGGGRSKSWLMRLDHNWLWQLFSLQASIALRLLPQENHGF